MQDFNMGAMENKSLNVFNTSLTLAREDTATDDDYERIEGVIGHEYFHNWTFEGLLWGSLLLQFLTREKLES